MKRVLAGLAALAAAACAHDSGNSQTIREMHQIHDWPHDGGARLYAALANDVARIARRAGRGGPAPSPSCRRRAMNASMARRMRTIQNPQPSAPEALPRAPARWTGR